MQPAGCNLPCWDCQELVLDRTRPAATSHTCVELLLFTCAADIRAGQGMLKTGTGFRAVNCSSGNNYGAAAQVNGLFVNPCTECPRVGVHVLHGISGWLSSITQPYTFHPDFATPWFAAGDGDVQSKMSDDWDGNCCQCCGEGIQVCLCSLLLLTLIYVLVCCRVCKPAAH